MGGVESRAQGPQRHHSAAQQYVIGLFVLPGRHTTAFRYCISTHASTPAGWCSQKKIYGSLQVWCALPIARQERAETCRWQEALACAGPERFQHAGNCSNFFEACSFACRVRPEVTQLRQGQAEWCAQSQRVAEALVWPGLRMHTRQSLPGCLRAQRLCLHQVCRHHLHAFGQQELCSEVPHIHTSAYTFWLTSSHWRALPSKGKRRRATLIALWGTAPWRCETHRLRSAPARARRRPAPRAQT